MTFPPSILRVRVRRREGRGFGLWLPLLLLWPISVGLWLALLPPVLVVSTVFWRFAALRLMFCGGLRLLYILCCLRGLRVELRRRNGDVLVRFL